MEKKQKIAILINALTIVLGIFALAIRPDRYGIPAIAFYTILSNILAIVSSVFYLIGLIRKKEISFTRVLRYSACCSLVITFLVVVLCLVWFTDPLEILFDRNNLYHHILIPLMTFYSYIFCESHIKNQKAVAYPLYFCIIYCIVLVTLNIKGKIDGPYPFFMTQRIGVLPAIFYCTGLGFAVYIICRLIYKFAIRTESAGNNVR